MNLTIDQIRRDGGTQPRDHVSIEIAKDYAEAIADGAVLPPVIVFYDGTDYWLADGFHRVEAHTLLGLTEIAVEVHQGDRRAAVLHSVGANADHGYRRSNLDKRRAVVTLLNDSEWANWSDSEIARRCHVSHPLVAKLRPPVTCNISSEPVRTFIDKHGNPSTMKVAAIGKSAPKQLPPVAGRIPDRKPDPSFGKNPSCGINEASRLTGFEPHTLASFAKAGEVEGAEKEGGSWSFDTAKLREWMTPGDQADAERAPDAPAPSAEPAPPPRHDPTEGLVIIDINDALDVLVAGPPVATVLEICRRYFGPSIPLSTISAAGAWMAEFAARYPEIEAARKAAAEKTKRSFADVAG